MNQNLRKEFSLKKLRRIVSTIYEENGYKILTWLEGACPGDIKSLRKEVLDAALVLDLAIDAISQAYGKDPKKVYNHTFYCKKRKD